MDAAEVVQLVAVASIVGLLIGAAGIGGVLLAPWLTHAMGFEVHEAVGIAMVSFIGPGLVALSHSLRSRTVRTVQWRLVLATAPGAFAGSAALSVVPERVALVVLAAAVTLVGLRLLTAPRSAARHEGFRGDAGPGLATGLFVGFASAITATGGPMILTPLVIWRGVPVLEAITLGLLVQLPIAVTATLGNMITGSFNVAMGVAIGALLVPGMLLGRRLGPALPRRFLERAVAILLLGSGVAFAAKALR
jgi:uncharacterized membrane protein YfcA